MSATVATLNVKSVLDTSLFSRGLANMKQQLAGMRGVLGRRSPLGQLLSITGGGGAAFLIGRVGAGLEGWSQKIVEANEALIFHRKTWQQVTDQIARAVPLLGNFYAAGANIREFFSGANMRADIRDQLEQAGMGARGETNAWRRQLSMLGAWGPARAFAKTEAENRERTEKYQELQRKIAEGRMAFPAPTLQPNLLGGTGPGVYKREMARWMEQTAFIREMENQAEQMRGANEALKAAGFAENRRNLLEGALSPMESFAAFAGKLKELRDKGLIGNDLFARVFNANRPQAGAEQFNPFMAVGQGNAKFSAIPPTPEEMAVWERIAKAVEALVPPPGGRDK